MPERIYGKRIIESLRGSGALTFKQIQERTQIDSATLALSLAHLIMNGQLKAINLTGKLFYELVKG
jgi:hypothetical protein